MVKKPESLMIFVLVQFMVLALLCGCSIANEADNDSQPKPVTRQTPALNVDLPFEDAAVTLPSPAVVKLNPEGRFGSRFQGNINYVRYQHDHYGQEMLEAFAARHYSPGKLLERMWDGEYAGKWLDAATRTAVNTGNDTQLAMVDAFAASLCQYQQPDGYMGVKLPTNRNLNDWEQDWDLWCQWTSMIGLMTHYELRGERTSLEAACRAGKWIVKSFGPIEDKNARFFDGNITGGLTRVVIIGQLVRLYQEELLEFVRQVIQNYPPIQQMLSSGKPYLAHPYMLSAILGGIVEYARVTSDYEMLSKAEQVWDGLVNEHMFPTGSLGERENLDAGSLKDVPNGQLQETCATTEWIFFTQSLYAITGRAKYAEALERTCYNALPAAQSADGMKWCYWTPLRYSKHWFHGPTRCCFWSGPRGIARLPQLIYATKENNVYLNLFESSKTVLATEGGDVQVDQDSEFPEIGKSTVILKTPSGWEGTLLVRIPGWATDFQIRSNGIPLQNSSEVEGYFGVNLQNSRRHQIEIRFDIPLVLEKLEGNNYVIRRGPEVLSIDARDNIDTWLGAKDDLISIPEKITLKPIETGRRYQWPGPIASGNNRRRYLVELNDARTSEPRGVILTPYADAGNEGAAFRTVFPLTEEKN
ncbi:MAG: beta-L-arabinofuranosidase domain-containing protein [Planctomycetota bacterium]|jgi:DUF1680 family protein